MSAGEGLISLFLEGVLVALAVGAVAASSLVVVSDELWVLVRFEETDEAAARSGGGFFG